MSWLFKIRCVGVHTYRLIKVCISKTSFPIEKTNFLEVVIACEWGYYRVWYKDVRGKLEVWTRITGFN